MNEAIPTLVSDAIGERHVWPEEIRHDRVSSLMRLRAASAQKRWLASGNEKDKDALRTATEAWWTHADRHELDTETVLELCEVSGASCDPKE